MVTLVTSAAEEIGREITDVWELVPRVQGDVVQLEIDEGPQWVGRLAARFGDRVREIRVTQPSLEQVFMARTGHRFEAWSEAEDRT